MTEHTSKKVQELKEYVSDSDERVNICILSSEKGMGKTEIVNQFFKTLPDNTILNFKPDIDNSPFQEIYEELHDKGLVGKYDENSSAVMFNKFLNDALKEFIAGNEISYLSFDNFEQFSKETKKFILALLHFYVNYQSDNKLFVFFIIDSNNTYEISTLFAQFGKYTDYLKIEPWTISDIKELLKENYRNFNIEDIYIKKIFDHSFNNAECFLNNIEYLKSKKIIRKENGTWNCVMFSDDFLLHSYKKIVNLRYELLAPQLKEVVQKAAIIGDAFSLRLLENPLQIKQANQAITEIENISNLIIGQNYSGEIYNFRTREARLSIESLVESEHQAQWNHLLGDFFKEEVSQKKYCLDKMTTSENLIKAAFYYENAKEENLVLICCTQAIPILLSMEYYYQALDIINLAQHFKNAKDFKTVESLLNYFEYICSLNLFFFHEAHTCLNKILRAELEQIDKIYFSCQKAYILYNRGLTRQAYEVITETYNLLKSFFHDNLENLEPKEFSLREKNTIVNVFSMMASLEQTLGIGTHFEHFNRALSWAKKCKLNDIYYSLLRKCTLAHRGLPAITLLKNAQSYFKDRNKCEYAMACHNLANEYLFSNEHSSSSEYMGIAHDTLLELNHAGLICVQIEKAVYLSVYENDYDGAYQILQNLNWKYDEDFVQLVYHFNMATVQRKLLKFAEAQSAIDLTKQINNKHENNLPYFSKFINAQEGYLHYDLGNLEEAYSCFRNFLSHSFACRNEFHISVSYSLKEVADKLGIGLEPELIDLFNSNNEMALRLNKENLIFCELSFWE